jgi:hypothetical protein
MALELIPMSLKEANEYVLSFHRHNKPTVGGKYAIGVSNGDGLVGVAIVGRPVARLLDDTTTAEVLRVCTTDSSPKNTCSMLYAACWRAWKAMGGKRILTYTLESESGSSLRGAGWKVIAESRPTSQGWSRKQRARDWQPVFGQLKLRWEAA